VAIVGVIGAVIVGVLSLFFGSMPVWFEQRTDDPIMKQRINKGSDRFFLDQEERDRQTVYEDAMLVDDGSDERATRLIPTRRSRSERLPPGSAGGSSGSA
jgi:hypothetical protein